MQLLDVPLNLSSEHSSQSVYYFNEIVTETQKITRLYNIVQNTVHKAWYYNWIIVKYIEQKSGPMKYIDINISIFCY